jgi:hypothetical protein
MNRIARIPAGAVTLLLRAALFSLLLAAPLLAVPGASGSQGHIIEAPSAPKTGVGLVLLFSLQRA